MNDILLSGYYGFGNAGDEAILEAAAALFKDRGLKVAVLSQTPRETSLDLGITAFERNRWRGVLEGIRHSRLVLSGGGGLFQDATSFRSLAYYLRIPSLAKLLGKKTMIFAQGIGPIQTAAGKLLSRWVCNRFADRITVRDEESKKTLEALGVQKPIQVTADLAFLSPNPPQKQKEEMRTRFDLDSTGARLGIVLRRRPDLQPRIPVLAQGVSALCARERLTPVLIAFQPGSDAEILESFRAQLSVPAAVIREALNHGELRALIANLDFVLAVRYHAMLFSALESVPFGGIVCDEKVAALAKMLEASCIKIEDASPETFSSFLERSWRERQSLKRRLPPLAARLAQKARQNIDAAVELLGNEAAR